MSSAETRSWPWMLLAMGLAAMAIYLALFTPLRAFLISQFSLEERQEEFEQPLPEDMLKKILKHMIEAKREEMLETIAALEVSFEELYAFRERRIVDILIDRDAEARQTFQESLAVEALLEDMLQDSEQRDAKRLAALYDYGRSLDNSADGLMRDTRALDLILRQQTPDNEAFGLVVGTYSGMPDLGPEITGAIENARTRADLDAFKKLADKSIHEVRMAADRIERFLEQMQTQWQLAELQLELLEAEMEAMEEVAEESEQSQEQSENENKEEEEAKPDNDEVAKEESENKEGDKEESEDKDGEKSDKEKNEERLAESEKSEKDKEKEGESDRKKKEKEGMTLAEGLAKMTPAEREAFMEGIAKTSSKEARLVDMSSLMKGLTGAESSSSGGIAVDDNIRFTEENYPKSGTDFGVMESTNPTMLTESSILNRAVPARKISMSGEGATRMGPVFVDSWYILGPFENEGRIDFNRLFPPSAEFDLDKTYTGKDGKKVQWNFNQTNEIKMLAYPLSDRSVYFVYSEVWFDQAADIWVAFGSDDGARFWVNDVFVFESANTRHSWAPTEGFRRVHFKQGLNKIRGRVESAPGTCNFSVILLPSLNTEEAR